MATLSQRVVQLALKGYVFTDIASMLGVTPVEVDEVLKNQAHELAGGEGGGVPRDEQGRPVLPAFLVSLDIVGSQLNWGTEAIIPVLGTGSVGKIYAPSAMVQAGPCLMPAGELCKASVYGPRAFGPIAEVEYIITNLDGSEALGAVAESLELPDEIGPSAGVIPSTAELNVFKKTGDDLTVGEEDSEHDGVIMSAAGGIFFMRAVVQLPLSS